MTQNLLNVRGLLHGNSSRSKAALAAHLGPLTLTPIQTPSGAVYEVSGGINVRTDTDVMLVVARDGIEPPTPAFSGLRSTD